MGLELREELFISNLLQKKIFFQGGADLIMI